MCEAVEDMMKTRERKGEEVGQKRGEEIGRRRGEEIGQKRGEEIGRKQGRMDMLVQLVRKGLLSVADAAEEAGLSCEAFALKMESEKS